MVSFCNHGEKTALDLPLKTKELRLYYKPDITIAICTWISTIQFCDEMSILYNFVMKYTKVYD